MSAPFFDTLVICTITGVAIAITGVLGTVGSDGAVLNGAPLTALAFGTAFPGGAALVAVALVFFAYTTILAWAYYGEKCLEYLSKRSLRIPYRVLFCSVIVFSTFLPLRAAWSIGDIANGLMAIPNLVGLLILSMAVRQESLLYPEKKG